MREKKEYILITFNATVKAMAFEQCCMDGHIPGRMIPLPGQVRAGCGMAWRMLPEDYRIYAGQIEGLETPHDEIYRLSL